MNNVFKKILAIALAAAIAIPSAGAVTAQAAKKVVKLSTKSITLTEKGKPYTVSIKNTAKRAKISWSYTSTETDATPITITPSSDKKKITIMALTGGSGTITCKVGKKKYTCKYKVSLPVVSNFSTLMAYIDNNGSYSTKGQMVTSGKLTYGTDSHTIYMYSHANDTDSIGIDLQGSDSVTHENYTLSFLITPDGIVNDMSISAGTNFSTDWTARITSIKATKLSGKGTSFYNIVYPEYLTGPQITSYQSKAAARYKTCISKIDSYLNGKFGYGVDTLGF